jgi:hypothetical protein
MTNTASASLTDLRNALAAIDAATKAYWANPSRAASQAVSNARGHATRLAVALIAAGEAAAVFNCRADHYDFTAVRIACNRNPEAKAALAAHYRVRFTA